MIKKLLVLAVSLLVIFKAFSQEPKVKLLLGMDDKFVKSYLDSVANANTSNGITVEERKNKYGNLSIGLTSEEDETILDCLIVHCFFQEIDGEQLCVKQLIGGNPEFAKYQLERMDKDFKKVSENKWSKIIEEGLAIEVEYTLDKIKEFYYLIYSFR